MFEVNENLYQNGQGQRGPGGEDEVDDDYAHVGGAAHREGHAEHHRPQHL